MWKKIWGDRNVLREGQAERVVFYYPGEDGTYLDGAYVRVYKNGMVDVFHARENLSCHIQNAEIIWRKAPPKAVASATKSFVLYRFDKEDRA